MYITIADAMVNYNPFILLPPLATAHNRKIDKVVSENEGPDCLLVTLLKHLLLLNKSIFVFNS